MAGTQSEWDTILKTRKGFFAAERALVKVCADYEKARLEYERACTQAGVTPHFSISPGSTAPHV